jgi:hypothetical protein
MCEGADLMDDAVGRERGTLHVEKRVGASYIHADCWGTPDAWRLHGSVLDVWDYKFGHRHVPEYENWQLLDYAWGIVSSLYLHEAPERYATPVRLTVVQPRDYHAAGPVRTWHLTVGELVARFLEACGVRTAFGVISIHNMPILDAFHRRGQIRFVSARGEAGACNMADAAARVSGVIGVCVTSTGTGCGNAAGAMVEAMTAGTPLLHLTGQIESEYIDRDLGFIHEHPAQLAMLRSVGIESTPALINADRAYLLPTTPVTGIFDHVITYVPSLKLFLDSTARFVPMGLLPSSLKDKPVVLAATGEVMRTPADNADVDKSVATVKLTVQADGSIVGHSEVSHHGFFEVFSRERSYDTQNTPGHEVVNRMLARFNETGTGKIKHPDPYALETPWVIRSEFTLDPMVNLPGVAAMMLPVGLSYGKMMSYASSKAPEARRFPIPCGSSSHVEHIQLTLPADARITRMPQDTQFKSTTISYASRYRVTQNTVVVERQFSVQRSRTLCGPEDDLEWNRFTAALKRDVRQQVFLE